ncbi:MAG: metallophosphoesterase [Candidatus Eremiobacteraeota bacterium]|nr:metallophosphoesterase [Candidatus Eremiobacteraeota bacterium]MCW5872382.1 metallophosphoesterase [Candidatus Eremiobacteraeota bacterium]
MLRTLLIGGLFWALWAGAPAEELRLVQFSDIHSGGPHFWLEALREATQQGLALKPQAILLTGDHGDNSLDKSEFDARIMLDMQRWRTALQDYPGEIFITPGNDDVGHNYQTQTSDLKAQWHAFQETFGERNYLNELGNGLSPSQLGGMRWLSLNSQIFSPLNKTPEAPEQARQTFAWLKETLGVSKQAVVILCHIAPSWDLYLGKPGWKVEYLKELEGVLGDYPGKVMFVCGHMHRNHVQAMRPALPIPLLTAGALATKYGYQPNWRDYRWQVDETGVERVDYTLHYIQHPEWTIDYHIEPDQIGYFLDRLRDDRDFFRQYVCDIYGHYEKWQQKVEDPEQRKDVLEQFWVDPDAPQR